MNNIEINTEIETMLSQEAQQVISVSSASNNKEKDMKDNWIDSNIYDTEVHVQSPADSQWKYDYHAYKRNVDNRQMNIVLVTEFKDRIILGVRKQTDPLKQLLVTVNGAIRVGCGYKEPAVLESLPNFAMGGKRQTVGYSYIWYVISKQDWKSTRVTFNPFAKQVAVVKPVEVETKKPQVKLKKIEVEQRAVQQDLSKSDSQRAAYRALTEKLGMSPLEALQELKLV